MESALHARDKVGVQDFVLLEDIQSERLFMENLRKRYQENLIYVSELYIHGTLRLLSKRERERERVTRDQPGFF